MSCCSDPDFQRHPDPDVADIGTGGGAELTVGSCRSCGARLVHCWVGGVAGGLRVVSQGWIDRMVATDPERRRPHLAEWFNGPG